MPAFICICNPAKVWDYSGYFAIKREEGYWVFPRATFVKVNKDDILYLRVTQADKLPGVYGKFVVKKKRTGEVPAEYWRPNAHPAGLQYIVDFSIISYFPTRRITPDDMKMAGISKSSPLLRVPQTKAAEIEESDAETLEKLIALRGV